MRYKAVVLAVALAFASSMVSACGSQAPAAPAKPAEAPKPAAEAAKPTAAPAAPAAKKPLKQVRFAMGSQVVDPFVINILLGKYLGWYEEEGIDFSAMPVGTVSTVQTGLLAGTFETGVSAPGVMMPVVAKGDPLPLKMFYNYTPRFKFHIVVREGSPIKEIKDLKGKTIGVESLGATVYPVGQAMLKSEGLDPAKDAKWLAVNIGAPAGTALQKGDVDAFVSYDTQSTKLASLGFKFTVLPYKVPPELTGVAGFYVGAHENWLKANPDLALGFARTAAKGTVFALANVKAAAEIFLQIAPEATPKGITAEQALADNQAIISARAANWRRDTPHPDGIIVKEELEHDVAFLGLQDKIKDPSSMFTNQFIDAANSFDKARIQQQAKDFKLK